MRKRKVVMVLTAGTLALTGCATATSQAEPEPLGELTAPATVLQRSVDEKAMLCLGLVAESFPPQCSGPALAGWDWSAVAGEETAAGVTWGQYDVVGTWDGTTFTLTRAPAPISSQVTRAEPRTPAENPADSATVDRALSDYTEQWNTRSDLLFTGKAGGRAEIVVIFDDGTMQSEADAKYGKNVVIVRSALQPIDQDHD